MLRNNSIIYIGFLMIVMLFSLQSEAQRVVTPVESNDLPLEYQPRKAATDTLSQDSVDVKTPIHKAPLFGGLMLTLDLASPAMNLFGTQYGNYEVALEADIYHRFFPVVEFGIGRADYTPIDNNYTYRCFVAPYLRLGANYNFFFNNGSESFIGAGVRYGMSPFSYMWDNIALDDPYWGTMVETSTPKQSTFAHWGELVAVLRVQVYKNFYMGWSARYRILFGCGTSEYGDPYFIPGFGPKNSGFGFTYTIGYRLPIGNKK